MSYTAPPPLQEVQQKMDEAAEAIKARPQGTWAGWVTYLLEALDTNDEAFEGVLKTTHEAVRARLEGGRW